MYYVNQIASCKLSGVKSKIITRPSLQPKAAVVLQNVFSKIAVSTRNLNKILPQTRNKFFTWGNISGTNEINNGRTILDRPSWIPILDTHQLTDTNLQQHRRVKFNQACVHARGIVLWEVVPSSEVVCSVFCFSTRSDAIVVRGEGSWELQWWECILFLKQVFGEGVIGFDEWIEWEAVVIGSYYVISGIGIAPFWQCLPFFGRWRLIYIEGNKPWE